MPARERRPLVSVCIPTYNGTAYLAECLDSVLAQTFGDFELLIVDDASSDGTAELIRRRLGGERRLRFYRNKRNLGLVANWNRCVSLARGRWIKFAFQDDVLKPACLERLLEARRPGVPLVACRRSLRFEGRVSPKARRMYRSHLSIHSLARRFPGRRVIPAGAFARLLLKYPVSNCVGEPTAVLIERSAFDRFGPFSPELINLCDWEFFARVAANSGLCFADETLVTFRVHAGATSWQNRVRRLYHAEHIDELVLRHEILHAPAYEPVRREAHRARPRVDLAASLAASARLSHAAAARFRRPPEGESPREVWRDTLKRFPRLSEIPLRRRLSAPRALAIARGLWQSLEAR